MKSATHILTGKRAGIDKRVWRMLTGVLFVSCGALAWVLLHQDSCEGIRVAVKGTAIETMTTFPVASVVQFRAASGSNRTITWQFGDNSVPVTGASAWHNFSREGDFLVTADAGNGCTESVLVHIRRLHPAGEELVIAGNPIQGPDHLVAGTAGNFTTTTGGAAEWSVPDHPSYSPQFTKAATYTFQDAGIYTLKLKTGSREFTRTITVTLPADPLPATAAAPRQPAPAAPAPGSKAPPRSTAVSYNGAAEGDGTEEPETETGGKAVIADEAFTILLNEAAHGRKDLQSFNEFLCSGSSTRVLDNDSWTTFGAYFRKIYNDKKYEIKSVQAVRDAQNCIINLKIRTKHKNLLGF